MSIQCETDLGHIVQDRVIALLEHVQKAEFQSYDYYDWWATGWGQRAKQLAYRTEPIGHLLFSLPILALEWWLPFLRKPLGIQRRIPPISVAHHGLACLELYKKTGEPIWLQIAQKDAERLMPLAVPDAKDLCWGFPFVWSSSSGLIPPNQPAATQSSYGFDLFECLWHVTQKNIYRDRMQSVARAMDEEYIDLPCPDGLASAYHGRGMGSVVINAISYRIHILTRAVMYGAEHLRSKVLELVKYILTRQQPDGSWFYGESPISRFIDHFHTCFVLKNLARANDVLGLSEISSALKQGIAFYWANLFDTDGLPKPFVLTVRTNVVKYESYDFAECLGLFALLGPSHGFSRERLVPILNSFLEKFWLSDGVLRFRVYRLPTVTGYPYYRFGMTAAMLALAQLLNSPLFYQEEPIVSASIA